MKFLITVLVLLSAHAAAQDMQLLPDTVYAWKKSSESPVLSVEGNTSEGTAEMMSAYGLREAVEAMYEREDERVRLRVLSFPSRERAFGFFRVLAGDGAVHGVVGDAFCFAKRETFRAFGPFVLALETVGRRAASLPDEALLLAATRALYRRDDCYGDDIPLPLDERILGSERYIVPAAAAWSQLEGEAFDVLRTTCEGHAAWSATYEKPLLRLRRRLIFFPFRQRAAAARFAAQLRARCEDRGREVLTSCGSPAYDLGGSRAYVALGRDRVLLVLSAMNDPGCCAWVESLRNR